MNKQELETLLLELDTEFTRAFRNPEPISVLVVGGACLLLLDITDRLTKDIDVIITDLEGTGEATMVWQLTKTTKKMRQIITSIGKRHGLPRREQMFFNDDCSPFLLESGPVPPVRLFRAYQKLHLYVPADLGYMLACKLMAGRPDKDDSDIAILRGILGVESRAQAQAVVDRFFADPIDQQTHDLPKTLTRLFKKR